MVSACVTEGLVKTEKTQQDFDNLADNSAKRAVSYMNLQQYKTAEQILKNSLIDSPNHSVLNYTQAILKLRLNQPKQAEKYFKIALKSDPKNSRAAHDYGFFLCGQNRKDEGVEMFRLAIANPLFRGSSLSQLRAGECIFQQDKDAAERFFLAAYDENKSLTIALFRLAELNYSRRNLLKARAFYQRYASVQKDTAASLYLAYQIEKSSGSQDEALILRKSLLAKFPGSNEAKQIRKKTK